MISRFHLSSWCSWEGCPLLSSHCSYRPSKEEDFRITISIDIPDFKLKLHLLFAFTAKKEEIHHETWCVPLLCCWVKSSSKSHEVSILHIKVLLENHLYWPTNIATGVERITSNHTTQWTLRSHQNLLFNDNRKQPQS